MQRKHCLPAALLALLVLLTAAPGVAQPSFTAEGSGTAPGRDFSPTGTLYDNDVANFTTSITSQDSSAAFTARAADDFMLASTPACPSNQFDLTRVRVQMAQFDVRLQDFSVELFADGGGAPTPSNAIVAIATFPQISKTNLGVFGVDTSLWEAEFDATGTTLDADTVYWLSGFGTDAAQNFGTFGNFFAVSDGAAGTTANGVFIVPDFGVPNWVPIESVIGGSPLAFSFAIDGSCTSILTEVPTVNAWGLAALIGFLAAIGFAVIRRF